jgi:heme-degrading monooxygenase HmoA
MRQQPAAMTEPTAVPVRVVLDVWGVAGRHVGAAVTRMATQRPALRAVRGMEFHKLLGTGSGRTFTTRDADPRHWALLTTWSSSEAADEFRDSRIVRSWSRISHEHLRVDMTPLISRGLWSGRTPFGDPTPARTVGPVAAITRARIRPSQWAAFWRQVPPVSTDLHDDQGLLFSLGIGEAPIGLQGTFSLWRDHRALTDFAQRRSPHRAVIAATAQRDWYAEELFARLVVNRAEGRYDGQDIAARIGSN